MTNYLLSIDPSMKNTGFTLWERKNCKFKEVRLPHNTCEPNIEDYCIWKPIWIGSFSFNNKKLDFIDFQGEIFFQRKRDNDIDLIIERGTFHVKNGIGYETQEHLRGFIAGTFNKLLTKEMLISPSEWKKWHLREWSVANFKKINKWDKYLSLELANELIEQYDWNIKVNNHDEADSLLIGWYYLNKENK